VISAKYYFDVLKTNFEEYDFLTSDNKCG
jgi:hypothetical protein